LLRQRARNAAALALEQGWVNRAIANHGIIIMDAKNTNGLQLSSSEAAAVSSRPMLTVTYDLISAFMAAPPMNAGLRPARSGG
jgi:hypothetical protein